MKRFCLQVLLVVIVTNGFGQQKTDKWLEHLLRSQASPLLQHVLDLPDSFQYQFIYTQIDRDKNNQPHLKIITCTLIKIFISTPHQPLSCRLPWQRWKNYMS